MENRNQKFKKNLKLEEFLNEIINTFFWIRNLIFGMNLQIFFLEILVICLKTEKPREPCLQMSFGFLEEVFSL